MDEQVEAGRNIPAQIQAFAARYPFPLDPFQLEAIAHLDQGRSVLVAAPTGTGKTLVAEYGIWLAQQRHQRVIYTTPLLREPDAIFSHQCLSRASGGSD